MALELEPSVSPGTGRKDRGLRLSWALPAAPWRYGRPSAPGPLGGSCVPGLVGGYPQGHQTHVLPRSPTELCHAQNSRGLHEDS